MAKVGEGDPRWIVTEREDGANVNAWHWQERDLSKHSQEQLKKAFTNLPVGEVEKGGAKVTAKIDEISDISGDVTVAQRKGKMMCYFELKVTMKWSGSVTVAGEGEEPVEVKGTMEIPEVDHDEFKNAYEIAVKCPETGKAAQAVEDVIRSKGREAVRAAIIKYFDALFEEYHIGKQLKSGTAMPPPPPPSSSSNGSGAAKESTGASAKKENASSTAGGTSFCWKMRWRVPQENLFNCFMDQGAASVYTRSPAKIDGKAGGQFSFLGGVISGYYVDVQPPSNIKMQWRLGSWTTGVHSSVVLQFVKEEPGVTLLEFAQSGIPAGEMQSVQEGWKANFFEAMRMVYGFSMEYI